MTVASEVNRSGPYPGNGVTTVFDYDFRILSDAHLRVIKADAAGVETTLILTTDYTVSGVGSANGSITATVAPATGTTITILRNVPFTQETDLENQGAYYAQTVEDALDKLTMMDQQLAEELQRAVKVPPSENDPTGELTESLADGILRLYDSADAIDTVAGIETDVTTVANIASDVALLADVSSVLSGTASAARIDEKMFTGDGVATTFTLDRAPGVKENVLIWIGGAIQDGADYSVAGTALTITPAVADGVEIRTLVLTLVTANDIDAMRDAAVAAAGEAEAAAASINQRIYTTIADFEADTIPAVVKRMQVQFRTSYHIPSSGFNARRVSLADLTGYPAQSYFRSVDRFMPDETTDATNGGYWVIDERSVTPLMFGAVGNDVADDTDGVEATHLYISAKGGGEIVIPEGTFRSSKTFLVPSNTTVRFIGWIKMTAVPADNYDTALVPRIGASNFMVINPQIDLNSIPSMNGFIMRTGSHEGMVIGGVIKNGVHDKGGDNGGRGFNVESDVTGFSGRNIVITGVKVINCYMGFAVRGGEGIKKSNIIIDKITIEDCDVAYWLVGNTAGYPHDSDEMQGIISNVTAYNCGLNTQYLNQDGAFVSDRGCNFKQSNIVLHNDAAYGAINSVWHGNGAKLDVDITFYGSATNIFDLGPYKESDAGPAFENTIEQCLFNVRVYGSVTDIIKTAAVGAGYAANTELRGRVGTVSSGRVVSSGYSTQSSLLMDFYEETNAAYVRGVAVDIGALVFSAAASRNVLAGGAILTKSNMLAAAADIDTLTDEGTYIGGSLTGTLPWTTSANFHIQVFRDSATTNNCVQRLCLANITAGGPRWFSRRMRNGTWQPWAPESGWVTPEHYGAVGDGAVDDTAAMQNALRSGWPVLLLGNYRITSAVSCGVGINIRGSGGVSIQGMGQRHIFVDHAGNGIAYTASFGDNYDSPQFVIKDVVIICNSAASTGAGVNVTAATGGSGSVSKTFHIENVQVYGNDDTTKATLYGFVITNGRNGTIKDCLHQGKRSLAAGSRTGSSILIQGNSDPCDIIVDGCHAYFVQNGVAVRGTTEGVTVNNPYFVGVDYGVDVQVDENPISGDNAGKQMIVVKGGHINFALYGCRFLRAWDWSVLDVVFLYEVANGNGIGVYGEMAAGNDQNGHVHGCKFQDRTTGAVSTGTTVGVSLQGHTSGVLNSRVGMNWFTLLDHGIFLGTNAKNVRWEDACAFIACTSSVTNNGGASNTAY